MSLLQRLQFSFALAIGFLVIAAAFFCNHFIEKALLEEAFTRQQETIAKSAPRFLRSEDFKAPLTPRTQRQLRSFVQDFTGPEVARVAVWSRDERIIFSDLQSATGKRSLGRTGVIKVLKEGRPFFETRDQDSQLSLLTTTSDFLDIYVPIQLDGTIVGAVEVYVLREAVLAPVHRQIQYTLIVLLLSGIFSLITVFSFRKSLLRANRDVALHDCILNLLEELAHDVSRLDFASLTKKLQEKLSLALGVDFVEIEILDDNQLSVLGSSNDTPETPGALKIQIAKDIEWIFQNRQPLFLDKVEKSAESPAVPLSRPGVKGYAGLGIYSRDGEIVGILRVFSRQPRNLVREQQALKLLASCLSIALENTHLHEQSREQLLKLEIAGQKLAGQGMELHRSNHELEQFAYTISRDLQDPIREVTHYTNLLVKAYAAKLDEAAQEFIHHIIDGAKRMHTLVNHVLTYTKVANAQSRNFAKFDSSLVLAKTLEQMRGVIREKGAAVTHDRLPVIEADEVQIGQLLQNLISNALTYCDKPTARVHISCGKNYGFWCFKITDNGIGIASEFTEKIFVLFERLHTKEEYPGTGIGLAVCKKIIERHGGRIWVESQPAVGSTFCFTLPFKPAAKPSAAPRTDSLHVER